MQARHLFQQDSSPQAAPGFVQNQGQNQNQSGMQSEQPANQASMASFVARLMSLSVHELQSLHADHELMRHLTEMQMLMENRLQQTKLSGMMHQQQQQLAMQHQMQLQQQHQIQLANQQQQQQQQLHLDQYYAQALSIAAGCQQQQQYLAAKSPQQHLLMAAPGGPHQQHQQHQQQLQLALDLRTSQLGYPQFQQQRPYSSAGSSYGSSAASSAGSSPVEQAAQTQPPAAGQRRPVNPKKVKLQEYQRQAGASQAKPSLPVLTPLPASNRVEPARKRACNGRKPRPPGASRAGKKYKGEFDEPSPAEVEQRQDELARPETNYHSPSATECACVLGSRFHNRTNAEMLATIERWRRLPTEERIKSKWELTDLPMDIPLTEIKKFEDLRRDASNGRADFGGASKRKPLGIRGTRQFLLILYCLWGHPGRLDPMQQEGYCPHCFAKIKRKNEQSTLVRVVNHFNMKHRRGANPRLSPHRDQLASAAASPAAPAPPNATEQQPPAAPVAKQADEPSLKQDSASETLANRHQTDSPQSSVSTSTASSPATPAPPSSAEPTREPAGKQETETSETTPPKSPARAGQVAIVKQESATTNLSASI